MPQMNILNAVEQEAFESAPVFNSFQRKQYFDFPQGNPAGHREPAYARQSALLSSELRLLQSEQAPSFRRGPFIRGMLNTWSAGQASGWNRSNSISMARKPRRDIGASSWTSTASSHSVPTAAPSLPKKSHVCCGPRSSPRSSSGAVSMS
jgi:hypothetical protein